VRRFAPSSHTFAFDAIKRAVSLAYMKTRVLFSILVSGLVAVQMGTAFAQSSQVPLPKPPTLDPTKERDKEPPTALKPQKKTFELAADLDGLFNQLKKTRSQKLAKRISERIWEIWQTSDSKSIDLLTNWARRASGGKKYGAALDLLDQVVVLRPDYAEGFNQRATLHYMMENYDKSIADIERTLALEPRHYGALAGLASIFITRAFQWSSFPGDWNYLIGCCVDNKTIKAQ